MREREKSRISAARDEESGGEQKVELSWTDHPFRELARLSWPIAVSMVSFSVMTLVDTLFVGRLGPSALAGVGLGGTLAFTLVCFGVGLLKSVRILVSQSLGAGRREELGRYLAAGMLVAVTFGLLVLALGQVLADGLVYLSASPQAGADARDYLRIRTLGSPIVLVFMAVRSFRYALGDSRTPMWATLVGNATNIVLDWVFIVELGWGVSGAAWASVIGQAAEATLLLSAQRLDGLVLSGVTLRHVRAVWEVGTVTGVQFLLEVGAFAVLAVLLSAMDEVQMAAHQVAIQVVHFTFLPILAVGEAAAVLSGQAVGANRDELVRKVAWRAMALAGGYATAWTLALAFGAHAIASAFTDEPTLLAAIVGLLYVAAVFQIFDGANVVARSVLQGTGDVRYPAVVGIVFAWLLTPPSTWVLGYQLGLGALGGWIGLCGEIIVGAIVLWVRVERGHWSAAASKSRERMADAEPHGERKPLAA